jgi:UDP-glucose 4-epimerase
VTTVLVTGAGGYVGQRLTCHLAADGLAVRALVRTPLSWPAGIEQVVGDLVTDPGLAQSIAHGVDVVIHLAGANEQLAARHPEASVSDTVMAAEHMAHSDVERIIYLSTVHVYGNLLTSGALIREDMPPDPVHPYAVARLACEELFLHGRAPAMIFRLSNGIGAPAHPESRRWSLVANELCREGAVTGRLTLRSPGQWRDFIALSDVETVLTAVVGSATFRPGVFNLASGRSITVLDLASMVQESFVKLGQPRPLLVAPDGPERPPGPYRIDVTKLRQLGLSAATPLHQAVDETVRFCLDHKRALR